MRFFANLIGIIAIFVGVGLALLALVDFSTVMAADTAPAQAAFSHSEGTFLATLASAFFLFAIAVMIGSVMVSINENTEAVKSLARNGK